MANSNGRFYFKLTSNGNLIGEFSNSSSKAIQTESARRVSGNSQEYVGTYYACWLENKRQEFGELFIAFKPNTNNSIFSLIWKDKKNTTTIFEGEGMLCDDILIGNYW